MIKERESKSGFHFYTLYQSCPRRFYFKYLLKWMTDKIHPALLYGQAIHHAHADFYKNSIDIINEFIVQLNIRRELYEDRTVFMKDLDRGQSMLDTWMVKWGIDWQEREELICVEEEFMVKIGEFNFTGRWDGVFKDKKTGRKFIREIKTTSYSVMGSYYNLFYSDQPTAYLYAWNELHPHEKIDEVQPDILYNKGRVFKPERPPNIRRSSLELEEFKLGMLGIITEITQKVKSLENFKSIQLFPRRGNCDGDGFYTCPYRGICRTNIDINYVPFGFHKEEEA